MQTKIYILIDVDGETVCAFRDREEAIKEATKADLDVEEINLY